MICSVDLAGLNSNWFEFISLPSMRFLSLCLIFFSKSLENGSNKDICMIEDLKDVCYVSELGRYLHI